MFGGGSITLFHFRGIKVTVDWSWFVVLFLVILYMADFFERLLGESGGTPFLFAVLSAVGFFGSILLHEFGHAFAALRNGIGISSIQLWIFGGMARMDREADSPSTELKVALAGPAVTAAIVAVLTLAGTVGVGWAEFHEAILHEVSSNASAPIALAAWLAGINFLILVFNLLPAFPLDGGRVTRALLWRRRGDISSATDTAAAIGRGLGYGMIGFGVLAFVAGAFGGLWLALIGLFVVGAAKAEEQGLRVRVALSGRSAGRLMTYPALTIPADMTVAEAVEHYFVDAKHPAFPVVDNGRLVGMVDTDAVKRAPPASRAATRVGEIAFSDPNLVIREDQDVAELLERPAFARVGRAVVLTADGGIGLLSITDVNRVLRALELAGGPFPRSARPA